MAYKRKFVILKKELGNMEETGLKGHGKLEVKGPRGTLTVNVENSETHDFYNVDLIISDEAYNLGKVFIDGRGRGKEEYHITQKEFKIEDIVGLLVTKDEEIYLGGYINKEDGRIERYLRSIMPIAARVEEVQVEIEEVEETLEVEVEVEEALEEEVLEAEEILEYSYPEEALEETLEEAFEEVFGEQEECLEEDLPEVVDEEAMEELPVEMPYEEEPVEEILVEPEYDEEPEEEVLIEVEEEEIEAEEENIEPDYELIEHMKQVNQRDQLTNYILSILRFFPYLDPFKHDLEGYNWWVVDLGEENEYKSFLPYFSYLAGGNNKETYDSEATTCNELMEKYQHYIFGLYNESEEVKYFVYGVPGSFKIEEHPNKGESGFNTWYEGKSTAGYWIIYIDPMTGKPIYPVNPMIPRD